MSMETIAIQRFRSPVGDMLLGSIDDKLCLCDWVVEPHRELMDRRISRYFNAGCREAMSDVIECAIGEIGEYLGGVRREFSIPIQMAGTEFQRRVWSELMTMPYGETISYGLLARRIGNAKGVRAVAMACASNPISIIVPCHRVIGSDKSLTGYGGGLDTKRALLQLEARMSCHVLPL